MLLRNLYSVRDNKEVDILLSEGQIKNVFKAGTNRGEATSGIVIDFRAALVFPGLINSHDHLDFNLFPKLGNRIYDNYVEWGEDIHIQDKETIEKVLKVSKALRIQWGIYKNLLNGITTVVNHGPKLEIENSPIHIYQQCRSLHSVRLEKNWWLKLNKPFAGKEPVVIHIGEGRDAASIEEINSLICWNIFKRPLIGIHGIAMNEKQARSFKALIWCPDSNYFLIGETVRIDKLKGHTKILFGTDSTVSAGWNLWEQLRLARKENALSDEELFDALTVTPAGVWHLPQKGKLQKGFSADMVIARQKLGLDGTDAFFALEPEDILMVIQGGKIRLLDAEWLDSQADKSFFNPADFSEIYVAERRRYVSGNLPELIRQIRRYYQEAEFPVNFKNEKGA
jgi:cytosine/adenosine deaminase-related metal-dependent hydrolase